MIQRYVEERFSTYLQLTNLKLETKVELSEDDSALFRFNNYMTFINNIQSEVKNVFEAEIAIKEKKHENLNRQFCTIFEAQIIYDNILIVHLGHSIEDYLLKKYQEGYNYEQLN